MYHRNASVTDVISCATWHDHKQGRSEGAYAAKTCDESFELFNSGGWVARTQAFVIALPFRLQSLVYDVDCPRYNYDSSYA